MKGGIMKKDLLSLLLIVGMFIITCGNEPPESFYEGTPEDSTEIHGILNDNSALLVSEDMFDSMYIPVTLDPISFVVADSYFREESTIVKQHVDSCALRLTERKNALDFWFAKDTTCTVYLYDTFTVISLMHYDETQTGYYFWQGDTDIQLDTVIVDSTPGYDELNVTGNGYRHIFFDRDEEGNWQLNRISYGIYNFPAAGTDIPSIDQVILTRSDGTSDTIIASSYDTLYTGHVMNRFRSIDSLLQYTDGETLSVKVVLGFGTVVDSMVSYFALCAGSNRVELDGGTGSLVVNGSGITNLYFESVVNAPYYYVLPPQDYKAQVWLIPVNVGGAQ
ncbi:MAG TPA: hypothetical protein ENI34_03635 [candidate division WOR-3 bacterium]|uniref:Uncharacterized protein n=1 Tax=candidate division WOR-3 bacterium TaxID=2052148 RepID=A0A9C9ELA2_UNCW3|nr:hypothetical protein [candidate division WOR-3 bacterium]